LQSTMGELATWHFWNLGWRYYLSFQHFLIAFNSKFFSWFCVIKGFRIFVELQSGNRFDLAYYFTSYWFQGLMFFEFFVFRF
jgi:hypothetical protein